MLEIKATRPQPEYKTLRDMSATVKQDEYGPGLLLEVCNNGFQYTAVSIGPDMYDCIMEVLTDHKTIEFFESLRK